MLAFSIISVVLDIVLGLNAILMFANLRIAKDVCIKMSNLVSCTLFLVLEVAKLLIEICTSQSCIISCIVIAVYLVILIMIMYSISKKKV